MSRVYLLLLLIVMSVSQLSFAETTIVQVPFTKGYEERPEKDPTNPDGNRIPQRPIIVSMSEEGIDIPSIEDEDILSYSVYTQEGELLYITSDDSQFVSFLFIQSGVFEICISTIGYNLYGWVHL